MSDVRRELIPTPTSGTLSVEEGGDGPNLVLLHRSIGGDGLGEFLTVLRDRFSVAAPSLPGYDDSDRPDWARSPRDLAGIVLHALPSLTGQRPVLVGAGLGGWVAAEMATVAPDRLRALVLLSPIGVQPRTGEIVDPFLVSTEMYVEMGFFNPGHYKRIYSEFELGTDAWLRRERNREMTTRLAWRPRMYDQTLPYRLPQITTPTLLLYGEQDAVVPRGVIDRYQRAIPGATVQTFPDAGHILELEVPEQVAASIAAFAASTH